MHVHQHAAATSRVSTARTTSTTCSSGDSQCGGRETTAVRGPSLQARLLAYELWPFRPRPWHIGRRMPTPIRDDFIRDLVAEELAQMKKGVWARQAKPILLELRSQVRGRRRREISASRRSRAPTPQRHVEERPYR